MIDFAPWPKDACDHADQKHTANIGGVGGLFGAKVDWQPCVEPRDAVPCQAFEIFFDGMIGALSRGQVHCGKDRVLAYTTKTDSLEPLLELNNIGIRNRPLAFPDWCAQHF